MELHYHMINYTPILRPMVWRNQHHYVIDNHKSTSSIRYLFSFLDNYLRLLLLLSSNRRRLSSTRRHLFV
jgi:hypothetical protein